MLKHSTKEALILNAKLRNILVSPEAVNDSAVWGVGGLTFTPNSIAGPDGGLIADTALQTAATNAKEIYQPITLIPGTIWTRRYRVAPIGWQWFMFDAQDSANHRTWFDLTNVVRGTSAAGNTARIDLLPNGFFDLIITRAVDQAACYTVLRMVPGDNNSGNVVGDISKGFYFGGAQVNPGLPGKYIGRYTG